MEISKCYIICVQNQHISFIYYENLINALNKKLCESIWCNEDAFWAIPWNHSSNYPTVYETDHSDSNRFIYVIADLDHAALRQYCMDATLIGWD